MQGYICEKSYKKINIFFLLKNKLNLYKIKKKSQMNHIYLFKNYIHPISFKNNHNLIKTVKSRIRPL